MSPMNDADAWLDALLREARSPALDDDGFGAGVLARLATPVATLRPEVALAALHHAEQKERRQVRWTAGGALLGAVVAIAATLVIGGANLFDVQASGLPVIALFLASCGLGAVAITSRSGAPAW